jgi:hypothetical protein
VGVGAIYVGLEASAVALGYALLAGPLCLVRREG